MNFAKFLRTPFLQNTSGRLLLDLHSSNYDMIVLLGDFNVAIDEQQMNSLYNSYSLKNLIKQPTCYKNPDKPTSIDISLTIAP